uniref:G-type lectin S-receptor-like serine/threonine-protein kinase RLK1 n=1 Tax=Nelumbo nucifera TaxID=4432 RepID=A0A822Y5L0_NELNU|nr:TPA_asm: hypothetical protein HUJ06_028990 [Nelumbo nucifera]
MLHHSFRMIWMNPRSLHPWMHWTSAQTPTLACLKPNLEFGLLEFSQKTVVWTTNRQDPSLPGNTTIVLQNDGAQSASFASMLDSGNFVLLYFKRGGAAGWKSGAVRQYPVDTPDTAPYACLLGGLQVLMAINIDGHLYFLNGTSFNVKNVTNGGFATGRTTSTVYRMTIDVDGLFRVYSTNLDNSTNDFCDVKGVCGMNAYCILMDQKADCRCLPGFDFIDRNQRTWGYARKLSAENTCGSENQNIEYSVFSLDHTTWEDDPYAISSPITGEEECKNACLEDYNCEAAVFNNEDCRKQKLPLRYGRKNLGDMLICLFLFFLKFRFKCQIASLTS